MTTREILAEIDMAGLTVCVIRVLEPGHLHAWSCAIGTDKLHVSGPSFDAALLAAWNAHAVKAAA